MAMSNGVYDDLSVVLTKMERLRAASSCDSLAQGCVETLYEHFKDSIVLARVFLTVAFGELPQFHKDAVNALAVSVGAGGPVNPGTPVLSLIGTAGADPAWNDRKKSQGHVGIPLISAQFIDSAPMMARLLKETGLELDWIEEHDTNIVIGDSSSGPTGTFYVADAAEETDSRGRRIISAQDFVKSNAIKSVFGFGGYYMGTSAFTVLIIFTRNSIAKADVGRFKPLFTKFKALSLPLVASGAIFSS
jgi:hypothetical protein